MVDLIHAKKVIVPNKTRSVVNINGHIKRPNSISAYSKTLPFMLICSQCLPRNYTDGAPDKWVLGPTQNTALYEVTYPLIHLIYFGQKATSVGITQRITHLS